MICLGGAGNISHAPVLNLAGTIFQEVKKQGLHEERKYHLYMSKFFRKVRSAIMCLYWQNNVKKQF